MSPEQEAAWLALMDVHEHLATDWTLIGGQMVHVHCAERNAFPPRPTDDADAVVDVRAAEGMFERFTQVLQNLGFVPQTSGDGLQHRWTRDVDDVVASIDVMLPDGIGERAASRLGAGGAPTLETPGGTQALHRSESVHVRLGTRTGWVRRPNMVGALVMKAAAHETDRGQTGRRHREDFITLVTLLAARDLRGADLTKTDGRRLRAMVAAVKADPFIVTRQGEFEESMSFLESRL